eukprot:9334-Eustigmatos_ZCMA.PRE.1
MVESAASRSAGSDDLSCLITDPITSATTAPDSCRDLTRNTRPSTSSAATRESTGRLLESKRACARV